MADEKNPDEHPTIEELEAAPPGSTLTSKKGFVWTKQDDGRWTNPQFGKGKPESSAWLVEQNAIIRKHHPEFADNWQELEVYVD